MSRKRKRNPDHGDIPRDADKHLLQMDVFMEVSCAPQITVTIKILTTVPPNRMTGLVPDGYGKDC